MHPHLDHIFMADTHQEPNRHLSSCHKLHGFKMLSPTKRWKPSEVHGLFANSQREKRYHFLDLPGMLGALPHCPVAAEVDGPVVVVLPQQLSRCRGGGVRLVPSMRSYGKSATTHGFPLRTTGDLLCRGQSARGQASTRIGLVLRGFNHLE